MGLFRKKKKTKTGSSVPVVPPIKPKPRVLKEFKDYRIVLSSQEVLTPYETDKVQQIASYRNHLVIEKKDTNAMEEPFYKEHKADARWIYENSSGYTAMRYSGYDSDKLLFDIIEEIFLNGQN